MGQLTLWSITQFLTCFSALLPRLNHRRAHPPTPLAPYATPPYLLHGRSAQGADMFDSVYPTRTARFGVALVPEGVLKLKNSQFATDFRCVSVFVWRWCWWGGEGGAQAEELPVCRFRCEGVFV